MKIERFLFSTIFLLWLWLLPFKLAAQENAKFEIISSRVVREITSSSTDEVWKLTDTSERKGIILLVKADVKAGMIIYPTDFYLSYGSSDRTKCEGNLLSSSIETEGDWSFTEGRMSREIKMTQDRTIHLNLLFTLPIDVKQVSLMLLQPIARPVTIK